MVNYRRLKMNESCSQAPQPLTLECVEAAAQMWTLHSLQNQTYFACENPAKTKYSYNICTMLGERRMRWADVVQMLYKCFVFAGELVAPWALHWSVCHLRSVLDIVQCLNWLLRRFEAHFNPKKLTVTEID